LFFPAEFFEATGFLEKTFQSIQILPLSALFLIEVNFHFIKILNLFVFIEIKSWRILFLCFKKIYV